MTILTSSYWFHQKEIHSSELFATMKAFFPSRVCIVRQSTDPLTSPPLVPTAATSRGMGVMTCDPEGIWGFLWKYKEKWHLFKLGKSSLFQIRKIHKSIEHFSVWSLGVFLEGAWILSKKALSRVVYYNQVSYLREKYNLLIHHGHWHPESTETTFSVIFT